MLEAGNSHASDDHLLWGTGCTAQKLVPQPASMNAAKPPPTNEPVRVRGVLTKSGEKIEYRYAGGA